MSFRVQQGAGHAKGRFEAGEKKLSYAGLCKLPTVRRNGSETPWLKDAPTHLATNAERPGTRLSELLRQTRRLSPLQEERTGSPPRLCFAGAQVSKNRSKLGVLLYRLFGWLFEKSPGGSQVIGGF
jgi:hypothetical protein